MPFYKTGGGSGKQLRVFWGGINVRSDTYDGRMPTDTDLNILYVFEAQRKYAFPWIASSDYVIARIYRISDKGKNLKRIRIRVFHNGHNNDNSLTGENCTVTAVSESSTKYDAVFDVTDFTGDFSTISIVGSNTNYVAGFEIIEAE